MRTDKIKFKLNPLFFAVFCVFCYFESLPVTALIYLSAILHELGHFAAARFLKVRPTSFSVVPFGMRIELDFSKISYKNQAVIALTGPLFNLIVWALSLIVARVSYHPLISFFAAANFFLALLNLVPAYPLDGGRITESLLLLKFEISAAKKVSEAVTLVFLLLLLSSGVYLLVSSGYNFSLILISLVFLAMLLKEHIKER